MSRNTDEIEMAKFSNIVFDFDGTLADTATEIVATMVRTFRDLGYHIPSEEAMRQTIGMRLSLALASLAGLDEAQTEEATAHYRKIFMAEGIGRVKLFPGVAEGLRVLNSSGVRLAIATSRNSESLKEILQMNDVTECFEAFVTNSDHLAPKPDPEMVKVLMERMCIKAEDTLVVGDTTFDIQMGNDAGCSTCAVTWGNHDRSMLESSFPSFIVNDFRELLKLVI